MSKKVLITGMTAQHYSPVVIDRSTSFTLALVSLLRETGHAVHIAQPSVSWDFQYLDAYDHVLVGVSAPMALSSNSVYGALSLIGKMYDSPKITYFVDAPEHWQIFANLKAISKSPDSLFKSFYSRRSGYFSALDTPEIKQDVLSGAAALFCEPWRTTIFPLLPWSDAQYLLSSTPENARASFIGMHIDSVFNYGDPTFTADRSRKWLVENPKSRWTKEVVSSLSLPSFSCKDNKIRTDEQVINAMSESTGVLIGPGGDKKFWWSSRYAQALSTSTPVATEWKDSRSIGQSWNHLAIGIEEMTQIDRYELAVTQKNEYFDSIPSVEQTATQLQTLIGTV